jgi:cell wall assembly regulator SMI1
MIMPPAKKCAKKSPAKKSTTKKTPAKKSTTKKTPAKKTPTKKSADPAARVAAAVDEILAHMREHAADAIADLGPPAKNLAKYAAALGRELPPDLVAYWSLHDGGISIFEYAGLSSADSMRVRAGLEKLRKAGTFDDHEIFEQSVPRLQPVKWHTAWIPLAQDGCGNMYCIDLEPGPKGQVGQVIRWEVAGGAFATGSRTLADVLERYAAALPRFTYQPDSGTFDGPYLDMLA